MIKDCELPSWRFGDDGELQGFVNAGYKAIIPDTINQDKINLSNVPVIFKEHEMWGGGSKLEVIILDPFMSLDRPQQEQIWHHLHDHIHLRGGEITFKLNEDNLEELHRRLTFSFV